MRRVWPANVRRRELSANRAAAAVARREAAAQVKEAAEKVAAEAAHRRAVEMAAEEAARDAAERGRREAAAMERREETRRAREVLARAREAAARARAEAAVLRAETKAARILSAAANPKVGDKHHRTRASEAVVAEVRRLREQGDSYGKIAMAVGMSKPWVIAVCQRSRREVTFDEASNAAKAALEVAHGQAK